MAVDAADSRSKRGAKLERDKDSARQQAKVWILLFLLSIILQIAFFDSKIQVKNEKEGGSCSYDLFETFLSLNVVLMLLYACQKVYTGCKSFKS